MYILAKSAPNLPSTSGCDLTSVQGFADAISQDAVTQVTPDGTEF